MSKEPSEDVTRLIHAAIDGEEGASGKLLDRVYDELRGMARKEMVGESPGHTLQATALVHEAYVRLLGESQTDFEGRKHFFGAAAEAMRRVLIERARRYAAKKRGENAERVPLEDGAPEEGFASLDLLMINEALEHLERLKPHLAIVVKLRYFSGLSIAQAADVLGCSASSVKRDWQEAKAFLLERMS